MNSAMANLYPENRTSAINWLHVFFGVGAVLGPRFCGYMIDSGGGWREVYMWIGVISLVPLPFYLALKFPRPHSELQTNEFTNEIIEGKSSTATISLWKSPIILMLALAGFFYVGSEMAVNNWGVLFLERTHDFSTRSGAAAISNFWLAMTAARIVISAIAHRVEAGKLLLGLVLCSIASLAAMILFADSAWMIHATIMALGASFSGIFATIFALGADYFPTKTATVSGILMGAPGLAVFILVPLVGVVAESVGMEKAFSLTLVYLFGLLAAVAGLMAYTSRHQKR